MQIGAGATDLLPSDLQFISSEDTFIFDWRAYFCIFLTEAKHAAAIREGFWQKKIQRDLFLDCITPETRREPRDLVQLATSLYRKVEDENVSSYSLLIDEDDHRLLSSHAIAKLVLAAGTYNVGADGRYRDVRRQRRRKIWERMHGRGPQPANAISECEIEEVQKRMAFERLDEGRVARQLLMLQVDMAIRGRAVQW